MPGPSDFIKRKLPLAHGRGAMPVLSFGTRIPDATLTLNATREALDAGFRRLDCGERYGNEGKAREPRGVFFSPWQRWERERWRD
jgi:alcohol dehydrogenase (NADP+)